MNDLRPLSCYSSRPVFSLSNVLETITENHRRIVYDEKAWPAAEVDHGQIDFWRERNAVEEELSGRGKAWVIDSEVGKFVLRPYRRGGLPGVLIKRNYLWTGFQRSRPWREFNLTQNLHEKDAPVPRPLFAVIEKNRLTYQAAIATRYVPNRGTLAQNLRKPATLPWQAMGEAIAVIHGHGVNHADLNAHNILIGEDDRVTIIDFDRARESRGGDWQADNLSRLRRSLEKLAGKNLWLPHWGELLQGYRGKI